MCLSTLGYGIVIMPLWVIAAEKRPFDCGERVCRDTQIPPADCPHKVTLLGSPPKLARFICSHCNARTWSHSPRFPGKISSPMPKKPRGPRR